MVPRGREIFCNRTLNLRAIKAIGYDMDYTLIHYNVDAWERQAYAHLKQKLREAGWPVADLEFQPGFAIRGLVIDTELGNLVKPDRFGYVRQACHGTHRIGFDGRDDRGEPLPSGVYVARLRGPGGAAAELRLVVLR